MLAVQTSAITCELAQFQKINSTYNVPRVKKLQILYADLVIFTKKIFVNEFFHILSVWPIILLCRR